jgi:hypothetical protein
MYWSVMMGGASTIAHATPSNTPPTISAIAISPMLIVVPVPVSSPSCRRQLETSDVIISGTLLTRDLVIVLR